MSRECPPSFQFYPGDFLSSTAVRLMTPEARGGYVMLLCHAWLQAEPGVLEDDDAALAALSELGERWSACAVSIRRAFRSTSREGRKVLVQDRMMRERSQQLNRFEQAQKGARLTNKKRWTSVAQRHDSESHSDRTAVTPSSPTPSPIKAAASTSVGASTGSSALPNGAAAAFASLPRTEHPSEKESRLRAEAERQRRALAEHLEHTP